jgi:aminobenzoyl-glutamate transport protein
VITNLNKDHPIAGLAMAYASSLGGFGANFLIGMQDALVYAFTCSCITS